MQTIRELAAEQYNVVAEALIQELGENELFAALWSSPRDDATFPVPGARAWEILNDDVWEKQDAWAWLTGGMSRW